MPERWESEIRKLRGVEPSAGLGSRFEEGTRAEPAPPTRQRVVAAVTALALFLGAGVFAVRVFGPGREAAPPPAGAGDERSLVLELSAAGNQPTATLRYGEQRQDGVLEGYEWCTGGQCSGGISDFVRYPPVFEYTVVPPSTRIEGGGDGSVERVRISTMDDEPMEGGPMRVPASNGVYVVEVDATWAGDPSGSANFFFGVQTLDDVASAPDVLRVDCGSGATLIDTAVVRTQPDGLHMEFTNTQGYVGYELLTPEGTPPEQFFSVGHDFGGESSLVGPFQPGRWEIGCRQSGESLEPGFSTMTFELVDPDDHYAPFELSCQGATELQFTSSVPGSTPPDAAAASLLNGLTEDDRLRGAGYGAESWVQGPTYILDRGGDAVARLTLYADSDPWAGIFTACDESGIELGETVGVGGAGSPSPVTSPEPTPPAENEIPDVLGVRCEGFGPAVDTTQVRLREEGLHVDALNVADADVLEIRTTDGRYHFQSPFESAEETFVIPTVDIARGTIWVGCLVLDENGEPIGGPEEVPGAYLQVEVLPA